MDITELLTHYGPGEAPLMMTKVFATTEDDTTKFDVLQGIPSGYVIRAHDKATGADVGTTVVDENALVQTVLRIMADRLDAGKEVASGDP